MSVGVTNQNPSPAPVDAYCKSFVVKTETLVVPNYETTENLVVTYFTYQRNICAYMATECPYVVIGETALSTRSGPPAFWLHDRKIKSVQY